MTHTHYPFQIQPLPYPCTALSPHLNSTLIHRHYEKHYIPYVLELNRLLSPHPSLHGYSLEYLLAHPEALPSCDRNKIMENAGGVYNHQVYFQGMSPCYSPSPDHAEEEQDYSGDIQSMEISVCEQFDSMEQWKSDMKHAALSLTGSGWAVYAMDSTGILYITHVPNLETTLCKGLYPLLVLDMWEHAYYLQYHNRRSQYVQNWFPLINWPYVNLRYQYCKKHS